MKIKIPKVEYVEKEVFSQDYEDIIKGIKTLKDFGVDVRYDETLDEIGWEIKVYIQPGTLCGHIHKGKWEERHVHHVIPMPKWYRRIEVEPIIDAIYKCIDKYGRVTITELYDIISLFEPTSEYLGKYIDNKYGWTKKSQIYLRDVRGEYYTIAFDDPELLD